MCSYNKLRDTYLSAHPLLDDLLRAEWGFTGVVVSDWGAVHDTVPSGRSGLDVEMPGPSVFRGEKLVAAVRSGEVEERMIDEKVLNILRLARRTGALGSPPDRRRRRSSTDAGAVLRRAAAESFVLLKNEGPLLPLAPGSKIAVLGRVAALAPLQGGGSSNVGPLAAPSPLDGISALAAEVRYEPGYVASTLPRLDLAWVEALDGAAGFTVEYREASDAAGPPVAVETQRTDRFVFREIVAGRRLVDLVVRLRATLTPPRDGEYVFGVNCAGSGTLRIGGEQVLELGAEHDLDWSYLYRPECRGRAGVVLKGGKPVAFELDYRMVPGPERAIGLITLRARAPEPDDLPRRALEAATESHVAVIVAGLGEEHECEGYDRTTLELPPEQRELIAAVAAANPRTVVVLSAGAPVSLDWADRVPAVLLVWYAGQELGPALGDVLMGHAEPGGRLPMTLLARPEDAAVLDPAPDDPKTGTWHYRERLFVGYRHFDQYELEPAYCFGHGLGYTRFAYEELRVEQNGREVEVSVRIRNLGERRGKEVVQLYVASEDPSRPPLELRAFDRIDLDPEAEGTLSFTLRERAFSQWDSEASRFALIPGRHEIAVGSSARDLRLRTNITFAAEPSVT
jgi:beta-glucosidase